MASCSCPWKETFDTKELRGTEKLKVDYMFSHTEVTMVWNKENWSTCVRAHTEVKNGKGHRGHNRGRWFPFFLYGFLPGDLVHCSSWRRKFWALTTSAEIQPDNFFLYSRRYTSLTVRKLKVHPVGCASGKVTGVSPFKWIIHFRADFMSVCLLYHEILYVESRLFGKGLWSGENDCAPGISKMHCDGPHFWLKLQILFTSSNMDEMSVLCFW